MNQCMENRVLYICYFWANPFGCRPWGSCFGARDKATSLGFGIMLADVKVAFQGEACGNLGTFPFLLMKHHETRFWGFNLAGSARSCKNFRGLYIIMTDSRQMKRLCCRSSVFPSKDRATSKYWKWMKMARLKLQEIQYRLEMISACDRQSIWGISQPGLDLSGSLWFSCRAGVWLIVL